MRAAAKRASHRSLTAVAVGQPGKTALAQALVAKGTIDQLVSKAVIRSRAGLRAIDSVLPARATRVGSCPDRRPGSAPAIESRAAPARNAAATPSWSQSWATSNDS